MGEKHLKSTPEQNLNPNMKNSMSNLSKEKNESKPDTIKKLDIEFFERLPDALIKDIGSKWLTRRDAVSAEKGVRVHHEKKLHLQTTLFKPILTETEAAYAVLTGSPERLLGILMEESQDVTDANKTSLFFKKCVQVNDPSGQVFRDISPAELIDMVCDDDMPQQVAQFAETLPEDKVHRFLSDWKNQRGSRGRGGADLVKVSKDPMTMPFDEFLKVTQAYSACGEPMSATFPLLQNPNGLIYYKDNTNQVHWYYADKEARTIREIQVDEPLDEDAYNRFKSSMDNMEAMSARRSSNEEHQLISTLMRDAENQQPIKLVREGHQYVRNEIPLSRILSTLNRQEFQELKNQLSDNGHVLIKFATENDYQEKFFSHAELCALQEKWPKELEALLDKLFISTATQVSYCDIQLDFNRYYNAYRKCIRLGDSNNTNDLIIAANIWEKELGSIQKEVMWLLQRYCEKNRSFYRMPDNYKELPFIRSLKVEKYKNGKWKSFDIYDRSSGCFNAEFGSNVAMYKGRGAGQAVDRRVYWEAFDLVAIARHVEDAKANVVGFSPDESLPPTPQSIHVS
ncbi:MAG: hypothetical protein Q8R83_05580 [Legionellaceae bacterium]|nr:hypothetical protein [Legionellaceae bacterium]